MNGSPFESTDISESTTFEKKTNRNIQDAGLPIHGFVTVVKNLGKPDEQVLCKDKHNLLTNGGRDAMHTALYTATAASQVGFNYIAVSSNTGGANATHTALAGEITSGGLERALATTRTHTGGTNTTTLSKTFTATATHPDVQLAGLFDAAGPPVAGVMAHENTFSAASLLSTDTLTVTWTLTLG